ncbi:hypothetical protein A6X21_10145 [Planctopirus hydrillae]|uniref:Uncharacterized protein n=1 Tax=Planctopirus hydrillae TaxID=1841610 RepID=A0A1C3E716_9PLAN|nr:hypothetical protein A6X21_10145 [Planctopirus hydrillae]
MTIYDVTKSTMVWDLVKSSSPATSASIEWKPLFAGNLNSKAPPPEYRMTVISNIHGLKSISLW